LLRGWELALQTDEIQRKGPSGIALAEFAWLGGTVDRGIYQRLSEVQKLCFERESPWIGGELAFWLFLAGELAEIPEEAAVPYRLAGEGEWEKAAAFWEERKIPYDRAVALSFGSAEAKIEALAALDELGAAVPAARLRGELVRNGVAGIRRGPIRATRENPLGLTSRQMDVLAQLAEGLTNVEIADRLFLSSRTIDHHVSAILGKLQASSRADAVTKAKRAGIL
jgi:DNA-binding CsgD family transcriptional regulator